jgi:DNA-binding GntR family transcriptional regulator
MPTHAVPPPALRLADHQNWRVVADRLARDVQAGLLPPGTWLKQIDLETRYGQGRSDVRRALDELVARRLVQHVLNRGYRVFELAPEQITQLIDLRAVLEAAVAERIFDRADEVALTRLEALSAEFNQQVRTGTPLDQHAANLAFHMALLELCPNLELAQAVRDVRSRMPSALVYQWSTRGWIDQSILDHAAMLTALRARDRMGLRSVMVRHLRQSERPAIRTVGSAR